MKQTLVVALFGLASLASGADQPTNPSIATYKALSITRGQVACSKYQVGNVLFGTYYDAAWAMEKVAAQVVADGGNPAPWYACTDLANDIYRDAYVLRADLMGSVPGYNEFSTGMRLHFERTAEIESRKGPAYMAGWHLIDLLGKGAAYCGAGNTQDYNTTYVERNRELSYCLRSMLDAVALGVTITPANKLNLVKNNILSQIDQQIISGTYRSSTAGGIPVACQGKLYIQSFMLAIQANSLIKYYETVGADPAIYNAVKIIADWLWDRHRVNGTQNVMLYENCIDDINDTTWNIAMPSGNPASTVDLNMFYPSIYQWLYMTQGSACGNTVYRDHADALFNTSVATGMTFATLDGKHYNQNFTYSREYVRLRSLPEPGCGLPAVPTQPTVTIEVIP